MFVYFAALFSAPSAFDNIRLPHLSFGCLALLCLLAVYSREIGGEMSELTCCNNNKLRNCDKRPIKASLATAKSNLPHFLGCR